MRTQKISIDCLTGDPPESLEKLFGFTEQELMAHIVTGATNLLKKLNVLRADVEVIKFWFRYDESSFHCPCLTVSFTTIFASLGGELKAEAQANVDIIPVKEERVSTTHIDALSREIVLRGIESVGNTVRRVHNALQTKQNDLERVAAFAFKSL